MRLALSRPAPQPTAVTAHPFVLCAAWASLGIGAVLFVAWLLPWPEAAAWATLRMKTNTALCLGLLAGAALVHLHRGPGRLADLFAGVALALGALTLVQYLAGLDLGLDQLITTDPGGREAQHWPNRMAPNSAVAFVAGGIALLAVGRPAWRLPGQAAALVLLGVALLGVIGYAYDAAFLYRPAPGFIRISPYTLAALVALAVPIFALQADVGVARIFRSEGPGGYLFRALFVPALLWPSLLGWLRLESERLGLFEPNVGATLEVVATSALLAVVVASLARSLDRLEEKRRAAEARSAEAHALLDTVFQAAPAGIAFVDRELRYLRINEALARANGLPVEAHYGKRVDEVLPETVAARSAIRLRRVIATGTPEVEQEEATELNGNRAHWHASYYPIPGPDGVPLGVGVVAVEISELLRARREAEAANRAKDEFLAVLGHELRNPLSPILTSLELMERRGGDLFRRERSVISRQVDHMVRLVDDLLDVSRIANGKLQLQASPIGLADVLAKGIELASPLLEQRSQTLDTRLPAEPLQLLGDAHRLAQVFSNLLTNAARYSEPGTHVELEARREGDRVVIQVRDQGSGIPEELLPHLFEIFVQGERRMEGAQGGLGLGLALVKSFVGLHGGEVEAASPGPGRGSTFTVRLPLLQGDEAPVAPSTTPAPEASEASGRILVVDDNVDAAHSLAELLRLAGHQVVVAHDGPTALDAAARLLPTVAFLDLGLPVMDGYELAVRLRTQQAEAPLQLVAVTGYGQASDRARTTSAGFDHHLVKPVPAELALGMARGGRPTPAR